MRIIILDSITGTVADAIDTADTKRFPRFHDGEDLGPPKLSDVEAAVLEALAHEWQRIETEVALSNAEVIAEEKQTKVVQPATIAQQSAWPAIKERAQIRLDDPDYLESATTALTLQNIIDADGFTEVAIESEEEFRDILDALDGQDGYEVYAKSLVRLRASLERRIARRAVVANTPKGFRG